VRREFLDFTLPSILEDRRPVTFVLMDIDGFGQMNDKFGVIECDRFLKVFAPFLAEQMRVNEPAFEMSRQEDDEYLYRVHTGGDEFIIVVRGTEVDALFLLSRLMDEVSHEAPQWGEELGCPFFSPRFNIAIYQMVHSTEWLNRLPGVSKIEAEREIAHAFPRAATEASAHLEALQSNLAKDLNLIEHLSADDHQSLLRALFELERMSRSMPSRLARGSEMFAASHQSYFRVLSLLAGQEGQVEAAVCAHRAHPVTDSDLIRSAIPI
jgi:diguanylate cyclase (GGDEF)-like protein